MESLEYNLNDNPVVFDDKKNKIFLLVSIISWLTLLVTSWLSLGLPYSNKIFKIIWLTVSINFEKDELGPYQYFPIMILYEFHYAVFILACSLATIGFIIYIMFRENGNVIELMLGKFSRFHFIPLFCISALFIIGESVNVYNDITAWIFKRKYYGYDEEKEENLLDIVSFKGIRFIFNFAFTIIALASLIFISIKTKVKSPWYAFLSINKGAYSCLIALLVYNFCFSLLFYIKIKLDKKGKDTEDWTKASGIAFSLIVGIINSLLSFILKDIMISFTNIVIYTGMLIYFFKIKKKVREEYNEFADGIIDMVVLAGNVGIIIFLSFNWRRIYKEKE